MPQCPFLCRRQTVVLTAHFCLLPAARTQFAINLDPSLNGTGGSDVGLLLSVVAIPTIQLLNPNDATRPLFQVGGPGSGLNATFDLYLVSRGSTPKGPGCTVYLVSGSTPNVHFITSLLHSPWQKTTSTSTIVYRKP